MAKSVKKQKLEDKILMSLNSFLRSNTSDSRLTKTSITKVEVNIDNSIAKVYWDTYDAELKPKLMRTMKSLSGRMRTHLASILNIRHVPQVEVICDTQYEDAEKITNLLNSSEE